MNVFSILSDKDKPIKLNAKNYENKTKRGFPYTQDINNKIKEFALCPDCNNPVILVNRKNNETDSNTLYAKHVKYDVHALAKYNQLAYDECSLANPTRMDDKTRRSEENKKNNEIKKAVIDFFDLIVSFAIKDTGIDFSDNILNTLLDEFSDNKGYEYRAINLYNLPYAFVYMTSAKDLYGCSVNDDIAYAINKRSAAFETRGKYKNFVSRKLESPNNRIMFYFSDHKNSSINGFESLNVNVIEVECNKSIESASTLYSKKIEFSGDMFFNTMMKRKKLIEKAKLRVK